MLCALDESVGTLADAPLTAGPERGANAAATENANDDAALSGDEAEAPSDVDDGDELLPRSKVHRALSTSSIRRRWETHTLLLRCGKNVNYRA